VFAVGPSVALALLVNEFKGSIFSNFGHWLFEVCWASSIYLESIAILPQLIMLQRHNQVENITASYMASLGAYRGFYILNWVYRYYHEAHYSAWIPWVAGVVQTALYADFFYYFWLSKSRGMRHVILPMSK
jgi:ER lumen protein retaining receptor